MTDRTPAETVEAVAEFLENDKAMLPDGLTGNGGYDWAIFKLRTVALAMRLCEITGPAHVAPNAGAVDSLAPLSAAPGLIAFQLPQEPMSRQSDRTTTRKDVLT